MNIERCIDGFSIVSPGFILRRTTDGTCTTFHPAVDFGDEGQGGIRSLGSGHEGRLCAWQPQRACRARARPGDGLATRCCATRRSASLRASLGPTRHERTGVTGSVWPAEKPSAGDAKRKVEAALTAAAIAAIIVQASRAQYHAGGRPCACPDDTMRNGRPCGVRSAYSRPGGASPLCYPSDVSAAMIESYRQRTASRQAVGR